MIIAFTFGLIEALLVLANCRWLRNYKVFAIALILASGLAATGMYFISHASKGASKLEFFPMFSPLAALVFFLIARLVYKRLMKKEIILYIRGFFPVRQWERYVTVPEKNITFILLVLSVVVPYLVLKIVL